MATEVEASFHQLRNDLYWKVSAGEDGIIRWAGYDDGYWWSNVSKRDDFRVRIGKVTKRQFTLNPDTNVVTVAERLEAAAVSS